MDVHEGTFTGGLPYLVLGSGEPLVTYAASRWTIETRGRASNEASHCEH